MKQFILIFKRPHALSTQLTAEKMQQIMDNWLTWMNELRITGQLSENGNRLIIDEGRVVDTNGISDIMARDSTEVISGYIIVKAKNIDDAAIVAERCPILNVGGSVEVKQLLR